MSVPILPEFITDRLCVRGITLDDAASYEHNFVDYEVIRHLSHLVPWPYPAGGVYSFLQTLILPEQRINRWMWVLTLKEKREDVIGGLELWRDGKPENRGFWLAKPYWGQGLMTEAVVPITDYAFHHLDFEKLVFSNAVGNIRSRRIKEKTGARLVDIRPGQFVDPSLIEREIWELTKTEWELTRSKEKSVYVASGDDVKPSM